jgi:hypothetical protein
MQQASQQESRPVGNPAGRSSSQPVSQLACWPYFPGKAKRLLCKGKTSETKNAFTVSLCRITVLPAGNPGMGECRLKGSARSCGGFEEVVVVIGPFQFGNAWDASTFQTHHSDPFDRPQVGQGAGRARMTLFTRDLACKHMAWRCRQRDGQAS